MTNTDPRWAIILHGGAKTIQPAQEAANRAGCRRAIEAGASVLRSGGTALDAVEATIRSLEEDPTFNAGIGSDPNVEGYVQMDAAIMDGLNLDIGAVAAIECVLHPISVARRLLREPPILLAGKGARQFAQEHGLELCSNQHLMPHQKGRSDKHDTVGCVALDADGNIAAGTSTGGLEETLVGRIGDSPMPGCGFYAENALGGVSLSGDGETIARITMASRIVRELQECAPDEAIRRAIEKLETIAGEAGAIVIDAQGRIGWEHNSDHFAVALMRDGMNSPSVWLKKDEGRGNG